MRARGGRPGAHVRLKGATRGADQRRMVATQSPSVVTAPRAAHAPSRLAGLDILRGVAALVVLFHHSLLIIPSLADAYAHPRVVHSGLAWLVTYTPLHLLWAGPEAVYVFFVLSGFVLVLPAVNGRAMRWREYYPRRVLRLYLPVEAAIVLALAWILAFPRTAAPALSWWVRAGADPTSVRQVAGDVLLFPHPGKVNTVLWSLKWEIVFSLLLPAYLLAGRALRRASVPAVLVLLVAIAAGSASGHEALMYMPMFGLGVVIAFEAPRLKAATSRLSSALTTALAAAAALLLSSEWLMLPVTHMAWAVGAARAAETVGACLMVILCMAWSPRESSSLTTRLKWLGSRSYSLYLVHEPVVVTTGFLLGTHQNALLILPITVPAALLLAELFYRCVERPSLAFAHAAGRRCRRPAYDGVSQTRA
jgi:peptidoglycan/LPS O-acetylase OafA/YrhL